MKWYQTTRSRALHIGGMTLIATSLGFNLAEIVMGLPVSWLHVVTVAFQAFVIGVFCGGYPMMQLTDLAWKIADNRGDLVEEAIVQRDAFRDILEEMPDKPDNLSQRVSDRMEFYRHQAEVE